MEIGRERTHLVGERGLEVQSESPQTRELELIMGEVGDKKKRDITGWMGNRSEQRCRM